MAADKTYDPTKHHKVRMLRDGYCGHPRGAVLDLYGREAEIVVVKRGWAEDYVEQEPQPAIPLVDESKAKSAPAAAKDKAVKGPDALKSTDIVTK